MLRKNELPIAYINTDESHYAKRDTDSKKGKSNVL